MRQFIAILSVLLLTLSAAQSAETRHVISSKEQQKGLDGEVFGNLKAALRGSGSSWRAMDYLKPGGTILVHAGTYKADRYAYRDSHGLMYFGTHFPADFSPHMKWMGGEKPEALTIKAAGDGDVILEGADCHILMDLTATVPVVIVLSGSDRETRNWVLTEPATSGALGAGSTVANSVCGCEVPCDGTRECAGRGL